MRLKAGCEMRLEADEATPLVNMLRPRSGAGQWVAGESYQLEPFVPVIEYVDAFGNLCQRLVAPKGTFRIRVDAIVEVAGEIAVNAGAPLNSIEQLSALETQRCSQHVRGHEIHRDRTG